MLIKSQIEQLYIDHGTLRFWNMYYISSCVFTFELFLRGSRILGKKQFKTRILDRWKVLFKGITELFLNQTCFRKVKKRAPGYTKYTSGKKNCS